MKQKTLDELKMEKLTREVDVLTANMQIALRLVAEMHAFVVLGKSPALQHHDAKVKKAVDEMLAGNTTMLKVLNGKTAEGLNS